MFRFSTRSDYDKIDRWVQERKFYATLPHKIDAAVEQVQEQIADVTNDEAMEWVFEETLEGDTPLGGEMRVSFKPKNDNTDERIKP